MENEGKKTRKDDESNLEKGRRIHEEIESNLRKFNYDEHKFESLKKLADLLDKKFKFNKPKLNTSLKEFKPKPDTVGFENFLDNLECRINGFDYFVDNLGLRINNKGKYTFNENLAERISNYLRENGFEVAIGGTNPIIDESGDLSVNGNLEVQDNSFFKYSIVYNKDSRLHKILDKYQGGNL